MKSCISYAYSVVCSAVSLYLNFGTGSPALLRLSRGLFDHGVFSQLLSRRGPGGKGKEKRELHPSLADYAGRQM
jgi:hypothetical protein